MLGAIIGDVVGSVYEWNNIKTKDFSLFSDGCHFTDDTIMTCAIAQAIMNGGTAEDFRNSMRAWGKQYPYAGYGNIFFKWLTSDTNESNESYGNGAAMRISPCAEFICKMYKEKGVNFVERAINIAKTSITVSHLHEEAIKGGIAIVDTIFRVQVEKDRGIPEETSKRSLKQFIEQEYGYDLSKSIDEIRPSYKFTSSCQGSVPQAIRAYIDGVNFEDVIRNAVSVGGDSDTVAAMTGSIAEVAYDIPEEIRIQAYKYLDSNIINCIKQWYVFIGTERLHIV